MRPRSCCLHVALGAPPEDLRPLPGRPAFPVHKAPLRWDVEGVGVQLQCGLRLASEVGCKLGLGRRGDERVCPGEVQDP